MRLIALTSNKSSFKTVKFNRTGLTLIVGRHRETKKADLKKTYNGVGKSLIVALVNYCLGANKNDHFETHLQDWEFTLTFEHADTTHQVTRGTTTNKVTFDGQEISLTKFKDQLAELGALQMPAEEVKFLTFRSLLSFFLRPRRSSYVAYDRPEAKWTEYQSVLAQSFLLGLDYHRAVQKHEHKNKLDDNLGLADRYKKDKELREFYLGEKDAQVELLELETQIKRLSQDLESFRVAENYAERQQKADAIHHKLTETANTLVVLKNAIADIDLALKIRPDVSPAQVTTVYEEAQVTLPQLVIKRLEDVQAFHRRLNENRKKRLTAEREELERQVKDESKKAERLKKELDAELQFLSAHRALDEYADNNRYLAELTARKRKIEDYQTLLTQYTEEAQKVRVEMAQATLDTNAYIRDVKPHLDLLMDKFREFSKELYGPVSAGLTVKNNDGENQCRYNIEAHIQNDAGDGINEAKIFCYDLLLLVLRQRHAMDFLFHDSRLYPEIDTHQRYSLFRLADRICRKMDLQYIATVNEDTMESMREVAGETEFKRLFVDPVVLELTDAPNGTGKLLGIQIDMKYDD